jgi:hypothetical protein
MTGSSVQQLVEVLQAGDQSAGVREDPASPREDEGSDLPYNHWGPDQYMPKGTDLTAHTADDLARYARSLNNRPRKTLGYRKPSERLGELLATTC